jgi:DNA polymerase IIIc chi subunit
MKDENEVRIAWTLWNLIAKLNDLLWDRYENEFIEHHLKDEEEKYWDDTQDDNNPIWGTTL